MSSWIPTLTKIASVKNFSVRTEGLPVCPVCGSQRLDEELYSESETSFMDVSFCEDCGNYIQIITPKQKEKTSKC